MPRAAILTIGNELVSGDVANSNGSWLARRLEHAGVSVALIAAIPDEIELIAEVVQREGPAHDVLLVTGGLGGTPDDITREAIAAAFGVEQVAVAELAEDLRRRFPGDLDYVARWAELPAGSRPLQNPLGGAPGFVLANVYVLPGLPAEMEAMFQTVEHELATGRPIGVWRRTYATRESVIAAALERGAAEHAGVLIGSYPTFGPEGSRVEVVLKSSDPDALAAAAAAIERELAALTG